jgi:hypothetical protein
MAAADPKQLALDKMRKIAVEELRLKNEAEEAEEKAEAARLELDNASDTEPRPDNMQEYIDNEFRLTEIAKEKKKAYEDAKDEYVKVFYEGIAAGVPWEQMQQTAKAARAGIQNPDIIVINEEFRKRLVDLRPTIYTKEMVDKAEAGTSVGPESKLIQLYRCLSVNISQELFYLTYRLIPDNTRRLQSAIVYKLAPLPPDREERIIPPGVLTQIKSGLTSSGYDTINPGKNNNKSYISYHNVPVLPGTLKLDEEITKRVKAEYKETDIPSTIPLFFIFITPRGHSSLVICIPTTESGPPKLFSFGLGFDGGGSGSARSAPATNATEPARNATKAVIQGGTGKVQLYSPDFLVDPDNGEYKLIDMGFLKQKHIDKINVYLASGGNVGIHLRNNRYLDMQERAESATKKETVIKENVIETLGEYLQNGYLDSFASPRPAQSGGQTRTDEEKLGATFHYYYSSIGLNKTYSYISAGVGFTKDYLNCTSFLSHIFSDRINCGIRQSGYLVADPRQCVGYAVLKMNKNVQAAYANAKKTKSFGHFFTKQPIADYTFRGIYESQMNNIFVGVFTTIHLETKHSTGYMKEIFDYLNYEDRTMFQRLKNCVGAACSDSRVREVAKTLATAAVGVGTGALAATMLRQGGTRRAKQRKNRRSTQRRT